MAGRPEAEEESMTDPVEAVLADLIALRHQLHQCAERSGEESKTARAVEAFVGRLRPDRTVTGLGGHGLAFVFEGKSDGPTLMLRAELDALPIPEAGNLEHRSLTPDTSHKCGHDGHMAILSGLGALLARERPPRGRVVLLFQPAEETGEGAARILEDSQFEALQPDYAYGFHNLPGESLGTVLTRPGAMTCASRGLRAVLRGRGTHAAHPERGVSPTLPTCRIVEGLLGLPSIPDLRDRLARVTVVHVRLGKPAFGIAPGDSEILATLRTEADPDMDRLADRATKLIREQATLSGLAFEMEWRDVFTAGVNDPVAVAVVRRAAERLDLSYQLMEEPMSESEDFGRFTSSTTGAFFGLGAGKKTPPLHDPEYDFPDALIGPGVRMLKSLVDEVLGQPEPR
jgi:amidohydrolase